MFRQLGALGFQRNLVQAIGFYLVYLISGVIAIAGLAFMAALIGGISGFDQGLQFGTALGMILTAVLAFLVLKSKGLLTHIGYLLVGLLSVAGAAAGGLLLSLIFVAFLTTRHTAGEGSTIDATAHAAY
jgi:hypothetical protein